MLRFFSDIDYCGGSDDAEFCNSEENSANPIGCANGDHELIRPVLEVIPARPHSFIFNSLSLNISLYLFQLVY